MKIFLSEIEYTISKLYAQWKNCLHYLLNFFLSSSATLSPPTTSWHSTFRTCSQVKGDFFPQQINVATTDVTNYLGIVSTTNNCKCHILCFFLRASLIFFIDYHAVGTFGCIFKSLGWLQFEPLAQCFHKGTTCACFIEYLLTWIQLIKHWWIENISRLLPAMLFLYLLQFKLL